MQFYKFLSYKSFYKRVLGEKIIEKKEGTKVTYRKTEEGEFERDVSVDRIYNLNNTLIIVDEAHNLTGNAYGEALKTVIQNSHNLKVLLIVFAESLNLAWQIYGNVIYYSNRAPPEID
jgi:DNA polymerase III delta prime subunit